MSKNEAINNLAWIIINSKSQGYVSENELEYANECLDKLSGITSKEGSRTHSHIFLKDVCSCGMTVAQFTSNA